jgi:hypothetical protein
MTGYVKGGKRGKIEEVRNGRVKIDGVWYPSEKVIILQERKGSK